jgi:hypothetical protein
MAASVQTDGRARPGRWRIAGWGTGGALVLLPLLGMALTDDVNWGPADFALAGALVAAVGLTFELTARMTRNGAYRAAVAVALAAAFVLVWVNLSVGVIGSEGNPANLMYGGVLAIGITGSILASFRPEGMARALLATAVAQALVAVIALAADLGSAGANWPRDLLLSTAFFATLWLLSAWLFRKAAQTLAGVSS